MEKEQKHNFMRFAIIASIITAVILSLGTFWTGHNASRDTEDAVHAVSLFYLGELTERRAQVVASTLQGYLTNLDVAIGLLSKEDLASMSSLQSYQAKMKQIYGLEKFAFVDSDGLIYTSRGTRTDIKQYQFDYHTISSPVISIRNMETSRKVILAMPVDRLPFAGKHLVVCFMEMDMERLLKTISLQTNNNTTFCNLYSANGDALTNIVLGGVASGGNLFKVLESAQFAQGQSVGSMRGDFGARKSGVVSFTHNDVRETMCYVPIQGTNWMLSYLVRESVISEQIRSIYEGIVSRSLIQSLGTVLVLAVIFVIMILQVRKASAIAVQKEVSEAENRVKQQELEQQILLQDRLLQQEKKRAQQDSMITALASDYRSVFFINLDTDTGVCYRSDDTIENSKAVGEQFSFSETFLSYAHQYVTKEYREGFLAFITAKNIRKKLSEKAILAYRYLIERDGIESFEMLRIARVDALEENSENEIHAIGVGFTNIDAEMRETLAKNEALSDALKAAEEASKAKTIFLSNMSHEIRTPMNAIIGLDNLALHEPDLTGKAREYLKKIGSSAQHLLSLINDILDMSRIESGRMTIRNEEFSFSKLIEQINTIFSGQCQEKGQQYNCHIDGNLDDYYIGDNVKLRQVLINILGNAVKFTPEGGQIDFKVEKKAAFQGKTSLRFIIKDSGIGMSKEFLPKIFDTFSQENVGTTNKYGSSGLGMSITKSIIDMMNGRIEVESEKGVGTTFTISVTLLDSDRRLESEHDGIEINPTETNVLVIDDDPVACDHAKLVLEKAGFAAETTISGQKAIEMVTVAHARRTPYNLIIVDWQMPEMDGVEVTRRIREIIGEETAIIILTAYNWEEVIEEAIAAGVDSFIAKPLFTNNLIEEFKNALQKKRDKKNRAAKEVDLAGKRILLAEDIVVNAEIMMEVLQMREILPEHAENGKIAVEMFASHPVGYYAAILMDMRMPEMDGLEATMKIRAMEREDAKTIPIIALTANAFDEDVQRSLQAGLNAHLSKPVNPDVLFETLESMLERCC